MMDSQFSSYGLSPFSIEVNGHMQIGFKVSEMTKPEAREFPIVNGTSYDGVYGNNVGNILGKTITQNMSCRNSFAQCAIINPTFSNLNEMRKGNYDSLLGTELLSVPQNGVSHNPMLASTSKSHGFNYVSSGLDTNIPSYIHPKSTPVTPLDNRYSSTSFSNVDAYSELIKSDMDIGSRSVGLNLCSIFPNNALPYKHGNQVTSGLGVVGRSPQDSFLDANKDLLSKRPGLLKAPTYDAFAYPSIIQANGLNCNTSSLSDILVPQNLRAKSIDNVFQSSDVDPHFCSNPSAVDFEERKYNHPMYFVEVDAVNKGYQGAFCSNPTNTFGAWKSLANGESNTDLGNLVVGQGNNWLFSEANTLKAPSPGELLPQPGLWSMKDFQNCENKSFIQNTYFKNMGDCHVQPPTSHNASQSIGLQQHENSPNLSSFTRTLEQKNKYKRLSIEIPNPSVESPDYSPLEHVSVKNVEKHVNDQQHRHSPHDLCTNWLRCGQKKCKENYDKNYEKQNRFITSTTQDPEKGITNMSSMTEKFDGTILLQGFDYHEHDGLNCELQRKKKKRLRETWEEEANSNLKPLSNENGVVCSSNGDTRNASSHKRERNYEKKAKVSCHNVISDEQSHTSLEFKRVEQNYATLQEVDQHNTLCSNATTVTNTTELVSQERACRSNNERIDHNNVDFDKNLKSKNSHLIWKPNFLYGSSIEQVESPAKSINAQDRYKDRDKSSVEQSKPKSPETPKLIIEEANDYDEDMFEREEKAVTEFTNFLTNNTSARRDLETNTNLFCHVCESLNRKENFEDIPSLVAHGHAVKAPKLPEHRGYSRAICDVLGLDHVGKSIDMAALITKTGIRKNHHRKIVWPPMVIIENARIRHVKKRWIGLNDFELSLMLQDLGYKGNGSFIPIMGKHGHRGRVLLRFPPTKEGWQDANNLHKQFSSHGRGFVDWIRVRPLWKSLPKTEIGLKETIDLVRIDDKNQAKLILYGYLAKPLTLEGIDPKRQLVFWRTEYLQKVMKE